MQAKDIMTTNVITASPDMGVREAAETMMSNRISALPVVDPAGKLIGIVSEGDFLRQMQTPEERRGSWWLRMFQSAEDKATDYVKSHAKSVKDVMTTKVVAIAETDDISHIAAVLEKHRIKRAPVVKDGKVVGVVSRANLLHAIASQTDIAAPSAADADIRKAVMGQFHEAVPNAHLVNVVVKDGVVTVMGTVDSEEEAKAIDVALKNVSGVKSIENGVRVMPLTGSGGWV